jgi:hypothetical protein
MPFPNKDTQFPTGEKQVETARQGGIASGEARRQKRDLRRALEILLEKTVSKDKDGKEISGAEAMALKQFEKALKGDTRAFEVIRDTAGQKPVEKVEMATIDQSVIDEVERMVFKDDDTTESN